LNFDWLNTNHVTRASEPFRARFQTTTCRWFGWASYGLVRSADSLIAVVGAWNVRKCRNFMFKCAH